uniref:Hepatoma-derived growth factor n=1 Tax=Schizaphis graminum TaxID=13262 RepID=A0A2S2P2J1_SCHGA
MSSEKIFSIKDKVFVKRRGYPAWPALISGIKTNSESQIIYDVYFYGTGNYSECKSEVLSLYEENKYKLGKPRKNLKKLKKKFFEALVQIENDTKIDFRPVNNVKVDFKEFVPPISTKSLNQELPLENESKNVDETELNLKNEEKSVNEIKKDTKVVKSRKRVSKSTNLKRKLSIRHKEVSKKLKTSKIYMPTESQPIVLLEPLNDILLERKMNEKLNFETADKNVTANEHNSETFNTTESMPESSDISLNCETTESLEIINDNAESSNKILTDSSRTSRFGRKIRPNRLSDHEFVTTVSKHSKSKKANFKTLKIENSGNDETDDFLKQNIKKKGSSIKARKSLKGNAIEILCSLDSASQEICPVNNNRHEKIPPIDLIKNVMGSHSNVKVEWKKMESNKADQINLLLTEVNLLDYINNLCCALSINHSKLNYEMALKSLEQISELEFNALMLKKHKDVVDKIIKVTKYVGDMNNWCLSNEEANEHVIKAHQIRSKAQMVLNKCISLFTVLDGQTFQEVYNQEVNAFFSKTQHLTNDQIYGCTSEKLLK